MRSFSDMFYYEPLQTHLCYVFAAQNLDPAQRDLKLEGIKHTAAAVKVKPALLSAVRQVSGAKHKTVHFYGS